MVFSFRNSVDATRKRNTLLLFLCLLVLAYLLSHNVVSEQEDKLLRVSGLTRDMLMTNVAGSHSNLEVTLIDTVEGIILFTLLPAADIEAVRRDDALRKAKIATILTLSETERIRTWCHRVTTAGGAPPADLVKQDFKALEPVIQDIIRRNDPALQKIPFIRTWYLVGFIYFLVVFATYRFSSLAASDLEPSLNVLDVGLIGTLLGFTGGMLDGSRVFANHVYFLYWFSAGAALYDFAEYGTHTRDWNSAFYRQVPYLLALLASYFWATFERPTPRHYWPSYLLGIFGVLLGGTILALAFYEFVRRTKLQPAKAQP